MTKEEAIENIKLIRFNAAITNANSFKEALDIAIEALSQPSLPSNLDEAAEEYALDVKAKPYGNLVKDAFKAGAEWMNKQMKMPNSTKLISEWHNVKTILEEKDFRGDEWRLAYNAFMFGFSRGINTQKTEK